MGIFVAMETYVTFFGSMHFFCKLHRIGPSNMCFNFGKNRLNIDDFISRFPFFINQPYHIDDIQSSENCQMTLTFNLDLDLFCDAKRRIAYKNGISSRINLQPTRSLYDFRFKSYGCYDDFHGFVMCLTLILIFQDNFLCVNSPCSDA